MQQMRINRDDYVWRSISSVEELGRIRMEAMDLFLSDYPTGLVEGRYVNAALPVLPFEDGEFCIALCSHLLFLYSGHLDLEFHYQSIKELCRVSVELRIFPLTELSGAKSRHLDGIVRQLENEKYSVRLEKTPYEFQKGSNEMIKICRGNL
jgi:hypothetical protein